MCLSLSLCLSVFSVLCVRVCVFFAPSPRFACCWRGTSQYERKPARSVDSLMQAVLTSKGADFAEAEDGVLACQGPQEAEDVAPETEQTQATFFILPMPAQTRFVPAREVKLQQQQHQQLQMPTPEETRSILHRLVGWKLSRGFPWAPNVVKYCLPLRKEQHVFLVTHEALFYKLLVIEQRHLQLYPH